VFGWSCVFGHPALLHGTYILPSTANEPARYEH
jgi:hypothetical protein